MKKIVAHILLTLCLITFLRLNGKAIEYSQDKIRFTADFIEFDRESNTLKGRGNFHLIQDESELHADEADINMTTKQVIARGHVRLYDQDVELYGEEVHYNMLTKKGKIIAGVVYQRPWIIYGPLMEKMSESKTVSKHARITSCDRTPPHYYLSTSKVFMYIDKYLFAINSTMWVDDVPIFYVPVFFKSMGDRTFSLDVRPGYSKREGVTIKTTVGIPIGSVLYSKFLIDYFEVKGTGFGLELDYYYKDVIKGTLYGYNIKERDTMQERWNIRGSHWQRLNSFLIMQSNLEFQSDENFNNTYFKESFDRVVQTRNSDFALTASAKSVTTRVLFDRNERFDAAKDTFVVESLTAPQISFTTSRIEIGRTRLYYTVNGLFNQTFNKADDFYRQSGNAGLTLAKSFRFGRNTVFSPRVNYDENWVDRRTEEDLRNLFIGRYTTNAAVRQRMTRWVDLDVSHIYTVRTLNNTIRSDTVSADKGIESNKGVVTNYYRFGRKASLKLFSGYNFHKNKGEIVTTYKKKMDDVSAEFRLTPFKNVSIFFRDTYDFFPRDNVSMSGNVNLWGLGTNWSYLKSNKGTVNVYHSFRRNITSKTQFNYGVRYIAKGPGKMNYETVQFTEHTINVVRDMHCFEFRVSYTKRGESEEILFNLQLKVDMQRKNKLFDRFHESEFYPWRE